MLSVCVEIAARRPTGISQAAPISKTSAPDSSPSDPLNAVHIQSTQSSKKTLARTASPPSPGADWLGPGPRLHHLRLLHRESGRAGYRPLPLRHPAWEADLGGRKTRDPRAISTTCSNVCCPLVSPDDNKWLPLLVAPRDRQWLNIWQTVSAVLKAPRREWFTPSG